MKKFNFKAAIFDLDGILTKTATVHSRAWELTFNEFLKKHSTENNEEYKPFTYENDYLPYVDGKPRYEGVKSFLESRNISIPFGESNDSQDKITCCGIGNRKNHHFRYIIDTDGVDIFPSSLELIKEMRAEGIKLGVASSSKNCKYILKTTGLIENFSSVLGGTLSSELHLHGKPAPDIFEIASKAMGFEPHEAIMFEDAIVGVQAGRNSDFALVIGVARENNAESLKQNGADVVVEDLEELNLEKINNLINEKKESDLWTLSYKSFISAEEKLRETLTTIGNGYLGTRGSFVSQRSKDDTHYPGTYLSGVYNKIPSDVHGRTLYNNDFVNCPDWQLIEVSINGEDILEPTSCEIVFYDHSLNMYDGIVSRIIEFKDKNERITRIESESIASMHNFHLMAVNYKVTPMNYSEKIQLRSALDGTVINNGVPRYRQLNSVHLEPVKETEKSDTFALHVKTNASDIDIFMQAKNIISAKEKNFYKKSGEIGENIYFDAKQGETYSLEKIVSIYTSNDNEENPENSCDKNLLKVNSFSEILEKHKEEWHKLWKKSDLKIDGDEFSQKVARLHIYHLIVTASPHNINFDVGMPARGLHGEAYRGHIFWDELYIYPFYYTRFPEVAKSLLMYRYNRLNDARDYAKNHGYKGAMFPWQTADDGKEETQEFHYNPVADNWGPDLSRNQRHVSIAIAYNVLEYLKFSDDHEFFENYGAELLMDINRFWANISEFDENDKKYHIRGVMGPDEFHEKYENSEKSGIDDNAYTNIMVSWLMQQAIEKYEKLPDDIKNHLKEKINLTETDLQNWDKISKNLHISISDEGIIAQFEGYFDLEEIDWEYYKKKYDNIHRMDRILKAEKKSIDKYKVAKQADTLMPYYLLPLEEIAKTLEVMGYKIDNAKELLAKNYEYYINRTSHGSTLSHVVHSAILKYIDTDKQVVWEWFSNALKSDINDTQGGTTQEGIHSGVMAGTLDIIIKNFAGLQFLEDHISIKPEFPDHWNGVSFNACYKKQNFYFDINREKISIKSIKGNPIKIKIDNKFYDFKENTVIKI
jgi:HAD superfamily hydrolase (TIGR01509 family)